MKKYIGFIVIVLLIVAGVWFRSYNLNKIRIADEKKRLKDSVKYHEAKRLLNDHEYDESIKLLNDIDSPDYYFKASRLKDKIQSRPWKFLRNRMITNCNGKFSNSATKNSSLWVEMIIDWENDVYLNIYEYASENPSNRTALKPRDNFSVYVSGFSSGFLCYEIDPKDDTNVSEINHSEGIFFTGKLAERIIKNLKLSKGSVSFKITMGSSSTYDFNIKTEGFVDAYKKIR